VVGSGGGRRSPPRQFLKISVAKLRNSEKRMVVGGHALLSEICGSIGPIGAKSPIFNRYSLVAPQP